ncbi:hypothetical protein KY285_030693 [Solanum tuberosum]|nr:hypothetical protein KY285_030693 [Solanum tuberosum]
MRSMAWEALYVSKYKRHKCFRVMQMMHEGEAETEERRRKKLEDLKTLENAHSDYCEMKMRLDMDFAGLLTE